MVIVALTTVEHGRLPREDDCLFENVLDERRTRGLRSIGYRNRHRTRILSDRILNDGTVATVILASRIGDLEHGEPSMSER